MKTLGIIGGLGPMATAYFMELIVSMTDAACDQEHLNMIIYNKPDTPDRTGFILKKSEDDPRPGIIDSGRRLKEQGADIIAIPCNTSHFFHAELEEKTGLPIINMIRETVLYLKSRGIKKAGILATDGTISTGLFQRELEKEGMEWVIPGSAGQKKVMHLIYDNVKAGKPIEENLFFDVKNELLNKGAQAIILGCTELSVIKRRYNLGCDILDGLEVLSKCAIERCGYKVRAEYEELIERTKPVKIPEKKMQTNVLEYLEQTWSRVPDKAAYANEKDSLTFKEVYDHSRAIGSFLAHRGYYKEPVVVFMEKHPNAIASFYGVVYAGCYYVPIDEEMPRHRIELIFKTLNPRAIIADEKMAAVAEEFNYSGEIFLHDEIITTPPIGRAA